MPPKKSTVVSASITDFFPRTRVSLSQPSSSQTIPSVSTKKKASKAPPHPDQEVISVSSASHITVSSGTKSIITVSDTSTRSKPTASFDPMESISSRGVPRRYYVAPPKSSPAKQSTKYSASSTSKSSFKRKAKLDSDSEIEPIDAVVHIPRSPARTRASGAAVSTPVKPTLISDKENLTHQLPHAPLRKKPRVSSPEPHLPSPEPPIAPLDLGELITVPSSQSDEQEEMVLRIPARDRGVVMEEVDRWRNEARSPISLPRSDPDDNMDVDVQPDDDVVVNEPPALVFTPESSPERQEQPLLLTPQQPRVRSSLPVTPVALTEASKTAKIIADIKARAYAEALSSDEDSPVGEFKELEDSDDEEDLMAGVTLNDPFMTSSPLSPPPATRYSLRDRGASAASTSRASTSWKSRSPSRRPRSPPPRTKKAASGPLGALLREKQLADKRGKGFAALRRAEDAMRLGSPLSDESDDELNDWTNEAAGHGQGWGSTSSHGPGTSESEEVSLDEEDQCRLLGEKQGKAVGRILDKDREKRKADKGKQKVLGVLLWEADAVPMDTDPTIPSLPGKIRGQPVLALLKSSIDSGELSQASLLLSSGIFANLNLLEHQECISYLCDLALSPRATALRTPAFHALSHIWQRSSGAAPIMPFRVLHSTLIRLGVTEAVTNTMGWAVIPGLHREFVQPIERADVLYCLVRLVTISTQSVLPVLSEIPDFVMALLLVGMDPASSPELQREIMLAVDLLCQSLAPYSHVSAEIETGICNKIIKFLSDLQPINKAHLIGLLAGGSGRTSRIARWVAHAVLTKSTSIPPAQYGDLPPLMTLIELALSRKPSPEGETRGIFELADDVDYDDLAFYVQVLSVAVSNVPGYVEEEASQPIVAPPASPGKLSLEKPDTKLTLVRHAIENLHSRIIDTRAAHLDRSRAKAALKQLSMRIHYQQEAALKSRRGKKLARPIQQYFSRAQ
ncbi:hypothetical protein K438DRAFT_2011771 [Mycena galopus ATCC 62051]|nr:hypothetical protein K438DRAFT_2011771 [Mycena galopus ATCC 62051]